MAKRLYKFHWDCGRQGDLDGLFIAEEAAVEAIIGKEAYFGEVLGKHSEIFGTIDRKHIQAVDVSQQTVDELAEKIGKNISGFNPFNYIEEEQ